MDLSMWNLYIGNYRKSEVPLHWYIAHYMDMLFYTQCDEFIAVKTIVLWVMASQSLEGCYHNFGGPCHLILQKVAAPSTLVTIYHMQAHVLTQNLFWIILNLKNY
jgi:hypothetical protein